jgi:subtilisin family serine protease
MKSGARHWLASLLAIAVSACASSGAGVTPSLADEDQILVMVPVAPAHFRAGATYGGGYDEQLGRSARRQLALDLALAQNLAVLSEWPMPSLGVDCFLMRAAAGQPIEPVLEAFSRDPRVAWAQALHNYRALEHADPLFALQPSASEWRLAQVHTFATGRDVNVAVIDSGVELGHPDLNGRIFVARNFVDARDYLGERHGTAVAGVIAANADNGIGIVGVAPQARLMALRACWEVGDATTCNSFTLAKAMQFALENHAQVINLSLSGPEDKLLGLLLDAAHAKGMAVVGAVDPAFADGGFPASHPAVIAVASDEGVVGPGVLSAPGRDIPTTQPGKAWGFVSGSSFAAAHISGVLALLREVAPDIGPEQARERLLSSSYVVQTQESAARPPASSADICLVLARAARACDCICTGNAGTAVVFRR